MRGEVVVQIAVEATVQLTTELVGEMASTAVSQAPPVSRAFRCLRVLVLLPLAALAALLLLLAASAPFSWLDACGALLSALFMGIFGFGAYRDIAALLFAR
jgi:phosphoglycerol transferase MdoB-like AlkP superfamily enzyme